MMITLWHTNETTSILVYSTLKLVKNFGHTCQASKNVKELFRWHWQDQTPHPTDFSARTPYQFRSVSRQTETMRIEENRNRKNALPESYGACADRMGTAHSTGPEKWQFATVLYRLQKRKRHDLQGRLSNPAVWWVFKLSRGSLNLVDVKRHLWLLPNRNWLQRKGQGDNYIAPRTVKVFNNAVRSEDRIEYVRMQDGHITVNGQAQICAPTPGRSLHLLEDRRKTPGPPRGCYRTAVENQGINRTEETPLPWGPYQLLGSGSPASHSWNIDKSDLCDPRTTTP